MTFFQNVQLTHKQQKFKKLETFHPVYIFGFLNGVGGKITRKRIPDNLICFGYFS